MPVRRIGDRCAWEDGCHGPATWDGMCPAHWLLSRSFGRPPPAATATLDPPKLTRFEALKDMGEAFDSEDPEFSRALERWLDT